MSWQTPHDVEVPDLSETDLSEQIAMEIMWGGVKLLSPLGYTGLAVDIAQGKPERGFVFFYGGLGLSIGTLALTGSEVGMSRVIATLWPWSPYSGMIGIDPYMALRSPFVVVPIVVGGATYGLHSAHKSVAESLPSHEQPGFWDLVASAWTGTVGIGDGSKQYVQTD